MFAISVLVLIVSQIVVHLAHEIIERTAQYIFIFPAVANQILPAFLRLGLASGGCFHFDEQRTVETVRFQKNQIGYSGNYTLGFELACRDGIAAAPIGDGEEPPLELRVLKREPADAGTLNAVFLIVGMRSFLLYPFLLYPKQPLWMYTLIQQMSPKRIP